MKLIYKDKDLVLKIIPDSSPAFEVLSESVYSEIVANNTSVSVGQTKKDGEAAVETTVEMYITLHGSQRKLAKFEIVERLGSELDEALSTASQEVQDYWSGIGMNDTVILDETCLILPLFDDITKYIRLGIVSVESIITSHKVLTDALAAAEETTTTTTEAPAE